MKTKTTKHTPGPWEYFEARDATGDDTISIRGQTEFIATMDTVSVNGGPYVLPPNGEANARLISAAPDLLAACEAARAGLNGEPFDIHDLDEQLQAAIEKAKTV